MHQRTPIALSLGVPLGTWLGNAVGWRMAFAVMSGLSVLLIAWILIAVPDYPGQKAEGRIRLGSVIAMPGVRAVLTVVLLWMLGHNINYTYIAPFLERAGIGDRVDLVLLTFGLASLLGIWIAGRLVDRALRRTVPISLAVFALTALGLGLFGLHPAAVLIGAAVWGLTFGGAATLLQTALADTAEEGADVALSMNVVIGSAAIALRSILGGVLLNIGGAATFPWAVCVGSGWPACRIWREAGGIPPLKPQQVTWHPPATSFPRRWRVPVAQPAPKRMVKVCKGLDATIVGHCYLCR